MNMRKPTIITPCEGILKRGDIKSFINSLSPVAITDDGLYKVHGFAKEGTLESILLSRNTHKGTTYHKVKVNKHKYQTDTFTVGNKTYNIDTLQEV